MLEQLHYLRQPMDDSISSKFLDYYFETLDPQHIHFLKSDVEEFEPLRTKLDDMTVTRRGFSDVSPGTKIFNRFMQRLEQRAAYVEGLLKTEQFKFDADQKIVVSRKDLPYPASLKEAQDLWRERLLYEYLQERLARADARKKKEEERAAGKEVKPDKKPSKSEAEEIVELLTHRYHRNLKTFRDWDNDDVLQIYLTTLSRVYDPHSDYLGHEQLESFAIGMNLSLFGIGAELTTTEDGYCTIRRLLPGGPAEKSKKIKEKDRIVAVAQGNGPPVDIVDMALNKAVQLIRGPKGTEVRLTVLPEDGEKTVLSLIRDEIKLEDQAAKAKIIDMPGGNGSTMRLGVIDLPSFYATFDVTESKNKSEPRSTVRDVSRLLKKLNEEKVAGVILDLRRNGGGSLEEAIRLTGLFIKKGPVVQVKDFEEKVQKEVDPDPSVEYEGPLLVLTSRFSASASEILAGALQDYGRAIIVGDSATHGKGTVQSVNQIRPFMQLPESLVTNDPGAIKLTIKKFYRPSGASTQLRGVESDIVLPSIFNESKEIGERALDNPLPFDTITNADFEVLNLVQPHLAALRTRSAERVAKDQEFAYIREDIEHFRKVQADKSISLNEKQRIKEKEEIEARQKARDNERKQRAETKEKVYEISLAQAALPGLPPPMQKTNTVARLSSAAIATNSASVAQSTPESPLIDDPDIEDKPPAVDAVMKEAQNIMVDYLGLLPRPEIATTRVPDSKVR